MRVLAVAVAIAVVAVACASSGEDLSARSSEGSRVPGIASSSSMVPSDDGPLPVEPGGRIGDESGNADLPVVSPELVTEVAQAIADLASHLGVDTSSITAVAAHELTWPDGSLGCPEPGEMYTQALIDGCHIELTDGEIVYAYNGTADRTPFLCEESAG